MTNTVEKTWCVVVKLHNGSFAIRAFKTRKEMREDYKLHKRYGYNCKTFRKIADNKSSFADVAYWESVH